MSLIPPEIQSEASRRESLVLVAKLFGASTAIAFLIKFGIKAALPSFTISAFDDNALNHTALIAITLPSLVIGVILQVRSRKSRP
jgi:hypothetical protein